MATRQIKKKTGTKKKRRIGAGKPSRSVSAKSPKGAKRHPVVVAVSGGFDPVHVGHVRLFQEAKKLGDTLIVVINNDNWLRKKKGYIFMPQEERRELIAGLKAVDQVVLSGHKPNPEDMSVSEDLRKLRPHIFANGGDRDEKNAADPASSLYRDIATCKELGIGMVFGVGPGGKVQSSSWLLANFAKIAHLVKQQKPPIVS